MLGRFPYRTRDCSQKIGKRPPGGRRWPLRPAVCRRFPLQNNSCRGATPRLIWNWIADSVRDKTILTNQTGIARTARFAALGWVIATACQGVVDSELATQANDFRF